MSFSEQKSEFCGEGGFKTIGFVIACNTKIVGFAYVSASVLASCRRHIQSWSWLSMSWLSVHDNDKTVTVSKQIHIYQRDWTHICSRFMSIFIKHWFKVVILMLDCICFLYGMATQPNGPSQYCTGRVNDSCLLPIKIMNHFTTFQSDLATMFLIGTQCPDCRLSRPDKQFFQGVTTAGGNFNIMVSSRQSGNINCTRQMMLCYLHL